MPWLSYKFAAQGENEICSARLTEMMGEEQRGDIVHMAYAHVHVRMHAHVHAHLVEEAEDSMYECMRMYTHTWLSRQRTPCTHACACTYPYTHAHTHLVEKAEEFVAIQFSGAIGVEEVEEFGHLAHLCAILLERLVVPEELIK